MEEQAQDRHNLLQDLELVLIALTDEIFVDKFSPLKLLEAQRPLTDVEKAVTELWRIRQLLREQRGLPVAILPTRALSPSHEYPSCDSQKHAPAIPDLKIEAKVENTWRRRSTTQRRSTTRRWIQRTVPSTTGRKVHLEMILGNPDREHDTGGVSE